MACQRILPAGRPVRMEDRLSRRGPHATAAAEAVVLPCFCANLRRAARLVSQLYENEPGWPSLSIAQFSLLQAIAQSGAIAHSGLGSLLGLDQTTVSRSLATLGRLRWVRMEPGKDRRERQVTLTAAGKLRLRRAGQVWHRAQARLRRRYGA